MPRCKCCYAIVDWLETGWYYCVWCKAHWTEYDVFWPFDELRRMLGQPRRDVGGK